MSSKNSGGLELLEVASILVYIIGILSAMEMYVVATSVALAVLLILFLKILCTNGLNICRIKKYFHASVCNYRFCYFAFASK